MVEVHHGKMPLNSRSVLLNILLFIVGIQLAVTDGGKVHGVLGSRYEALASV